MGRTLDSNNEGLARRSVTRGGVIRGCDPVERNPTQYVELLARLKVGPCPSTSGFITQEHVPHINVSKWFLELSTRRLGLGDGAAPRMAAVTLTSCAATHRRSTYASAAVAASSYTPPLTACSPHRFTPRAAAFKNSALMRLGSAGSSKGNMHTCLWVAMYAVQSSNE